MLLNEIVLGFFETTIPWMRPFEIRNPMDNDWEKYSDHHHQQYDMWIPSLLEYLLQSLEYQTILDLGCGDGSLLCAMSQKGYLDRKTALAVDISKSRVAVVRESKLGVHCIAGGACAVPIKSESVDLLVSTQVIEHVPDDVGMIREIGRILTPQGIAYISTVFRNQNAWYFYKNQGRYVLDPTHAREYTSNENLLPRLEDCGFAILREQKLPMIRPLIGNTLLSRIGAPRDTLVKHKFIRFLRRVRVPLPGYYNWEIVARKDRKDGSPEG